MKKILASVFLPLATVVCITGCNSPNLASQSRENGLGNAFEAHMTLDLERLNAEGTIKRFGDGEWQLQFDSPNTLSGVQMTFSQGTVTANYKGLNFSVPKSALPVKAMTLDLIEAVDTNARLEQLSGTENNGCLEISGTLDAGEYTLRVDENGLPAAFEMPNNNLTIRFEEVKVITGAAESTTEMPPETTTIATETTENT